MWYSVEREWQSLAIFYLIGENFEIKTAHCLSFRTNNTHDPVTFHHSPAMCVCCASTSLKANFWFSQMSDVEFFWHRCIKQRNNLFCFISFFERKICVTLFYIYMYICCVFLVILLRTTMFVHTISAPWRRPSERKFNFYGMNRQKKNKKHSAHSNHTNSFR